jgi:hypothetical protein
MLLSMLSSPAPVSSKSHVTPAAPAMARRSVRRPVAAPSSRKGGAGGRREGREPGEEGSRKCSRRLKVPGQTRLA